MRNQWWAAPGLAVAAVVLLAACGTSSSNGSGGSGSSSTKSTAGSGAGSSGSSASTTSHMSATGLKTATTGKGTVLTTASGRTIYWFAIDTAGQSKCYSTCASYWPPVIGKPTVASGVSLMGKLGTIKRSNGQLQATYEGHPLYTYKGDTGSGQVNGNDINTSGGLWWAMTPSGAKLKAAKTTKKKKSSSGGGGYGY
jgi:predicted lipoprotein with Yx(FWY)xxD motif